MSLNSINNFIGFLKVNKPMISINSEKTFENNIVKLLLRIIFVQIDNKLLKLTKVSNFYRFISIKVINLQTIRKSIQFKTADKIKETF